MLCGREGRTPRRTLEVADIFRQYATRLGQLSRHCARTVRAIVSCRTARLGGHVRRCDQCGYRETSYNSCRNRHCPKCQGLDEVRWVEAQRASLLPIGYHHVVFTVPEALQVLFRAAPRATYNRLFQAVSQTLLEVGERPRNLGARIGFTAVLHTWTQTLLFHPHLHCVVTGGGLSRDGTRWVPARARFLFSVRILAAVFRGKLLHGLESDIAAGRIPVARDQANAILRRAARKDWVVYSKPPFAGPESVLRYLGRYTHRIAISNHRLVELRGDQVTFHWRDRADGNQRKTMTLEASEFLRRFLLHVLPPGLQRIRHYGLLANGQRKQTLARCRELLKAPRGEPEPDSSAAPEPWRDLLTRVTGTDPLRCPRCRVGLLHDVERLEPLDHAARAPPQLERAP